MSYERLKLWKKSENDLIQSLNLVPEEVETLEGGIVVYKYNYTGWGEKLDVNNIGLIDKSLLTPIDTILSLIADSLLSLDLSAFIDSSGEHSFALGVLDLADNVSFYSKEKLITDGIDITVLAGDLLGPSGNGSGYAPQTSVWPSLSFSKDSFSIEALLCSSVFFVISIELESLTVPNTS